ncbi:hypothetical protein BGZ97_012918 [Linnemannia gamsii]|uniref:Uncharacterized protein n=1 Tax=Linnemannia gamsii TaxID=64522 RepID=A0A9P6ULB2_9FUNG|nr:hypothetical protein BGZ97_012918 [Linnemannia gamsii]
MLSPCFSEDTVSLSSSGGGTPDHFSRPYHQHPQQQVLTEAATDLVMRQQHQQQQQQQRRDESALDDDTKDNRNCLGIVVDDDRCFGTSTCKTNSSSNDASASIMALLMMNQPRPVLSSPMVEEYHHPHLNHSQQQLYQEQQQQSQQFFAQRGVCPQSNTLGRDNAYNTLIQGIETCRGRSANSRHYQHRRSESDSGDFAMHGSGGFHPLGFESQRVVQQQFNQSVRGKNPQGRHLKQQPQKHPQKQYIQLHHQYQQQQQGDGNGGLGKRRKDQRRFSTPHQQNNFNYNHQHRRQSFDILLSNSKDQHNVATPSPVVQETPSNSVSQTETAVVAEEILLQAPVFCRRRCISSGDFNPDPIAPIMPPSICSALRKRHARRMSCDGRLETYITSLSASDSSQSSEPSAVAATVKVTVSSRSNSHRLQQQQHHFNQNQNQNQIQVNAGRTQQNCARGQIQGSSGMMNQSDVGCRAKRHSLTISTDFPKDSLRDTSMSSVSDAGSDRRASISSSISDISISLSHSTTLSSSSSSTSLSSGSDNSVCTRKGGPPVHYTLMCWIGGRWPCRLRPLIKKSTLNDIHVMLRRNLKLPPNYFIDIEFEWQGQTYMIMDATHWQWAREQVHDGDMAIRCKIWQKRFTR